MQKKIWRKKAVRFETSKSAKNTGLAEVDKLDIDKSKTVPTDLSELCNVVKNDVVKKTVYDDELIAKFDIIYAIDTWELVKKLTIR